MVKVKVRITVVVPKLVDVMEDVAVVIGSSVRNGAGVGTASASRFETGVELTICLTSVDGTSGCDVVVVGNSPCDG